MQQLTNRPADVFISERFISSWFDVAFESEWGNELMDSQQWVEKGGQKMKRMGREGGGGYKENDSTTNCFPLGCPLGLEPTFGPVLSFSLNHSPLICPLLFFSFFFLSLHSSHSVTTSPSVHFNAYMFDWRNNAIKAVLRGLAGTDVVVQCVL